jgi:hypothetical protein
VIVESTRDEEANRRAGLMADPVAAGLFETPLAIADWLGARPLRKQSVWLQVPIVDGRWVVAYEVVPRDGRMIVAETRVRPNGRLPEEGVTARRVLREVKVAEHLLEHRRRLHPKLVKVYGKEAVDGSKPAARKRGRGGRPLDWTDLELAKLARRYVELCKDDRRRFPVVEVLAEREHLSIGRVRDLLTLARKRRVLTPSPRGKAGGELTIRARVMLTPDDKPRKRQRRS